MFHESHKYLESVWHNPLSVSVSLFVLSFDLSSLSFLTFQSTLTHNERDVKREGAIRGKILQKVYSSLSACHGLTKRGRQSMESVIRQLERVSWDRPEGPVDGICMHYSIVFTKTSHCFTDVFDLLRVASSSSFFLLFEDSLHEEVISFVNAQLNAAWEGKAKVWEWVVWKG